MLLYSACWYYDDLIQTTRIDKTEVETSKGEWERIINLYFLLHKVTYLVKWAMFCGYHVIMKLDIMYNCNRDMKVSLRTPDILLA